MLEMITGNPVIFWAIVFGICLAIEAATSGLTTIWFAAGALLALVASLFHLNFGIQSAVFLVSSVILLAFTRKIFIEKLGTGKEKTNVDALAGQKGMLTGAIKPYEAGTLKLNGKEWSAVLMDRSASLEAGTEVEVIAIEGVKAVVKPLESE